jgi:hypothetical protein
VEHVLSECSVDTTLCSYGVRSGGEELGDTGRVEASFSKAEGRSQTGATSSDDNGIVFVIDDGVLAGDEAGCLLGPEVLGSEDAGGGAGRRESSR